MSIVAKGRSAELSYDSLSYVEAEKTIRCRHDQIIVEPLPVDHALPTLAQLGFIIQEDMRPLRGVVKVVGPGHYPWRYDHPDKHKRTKMWKSKTFQPTELQVGDVVELGRAQETRGYAFQTFMWGDKLHVICREADVAGVGIQPCVGNDPSCPCQDGDQCHYRDAPDGTKAWRVAPQYTLDAPYCIPGVSQTDVDAIA